MTDTSRIERFRTLAEQDPNDELAHFSLGNALFEAEQFQEAAQSFQRVVALNNQNSKAQERLGAAQIKCGDSELAIQTLRNGYIIAHKKGDLEPMNAMGTLLQELGVEPPAIGQKKAGVQGEKGGTGDWSCGRCGGSGPKLPACRSNFGSVSSGYWMTLPFNSSGASSRFCGPVPRKIPTIGSNSRSTNP